MGKCLRKALALLKEGVPFGMPTDTVYGLAANALDDQAVARIYALKNRPNFNPLIVHIHTLEAALKYGVFNEKALILANHFWAPALTASALTIVVPVQPSAPISKLALAGLETIGLRVPNHAICLELLRKFKLPVAAPSANLSTQLSPTCKQHVIDQIPNLYVLDGGSCTVGIESTIVGCINDKVHLLRPGIVTKESIEEVVGPISLETENLKAPGMLKKHYSPRKSLRMNVDSPNPDEVFIGFGEMNCDFNLSPTGDLVEAAANLFKILHHCDNLNNKEIAVGKIPNEGIGIAINDRLTRASYKGE